MNARVPAVAVLFGLFLVHIAAAQAILQFEILDKGTGEPLPAKLIFYQAGNVPDLHIAPATGICPENNGVYTASGRATIALPPGTYDVIASRGMEYSIDRKTLRLANGKTATARFGLVREVYTEGFVPCDLHFHTNRSDGQPTPEQRVISLAGEGVAFGIFTDHHVITDGSAFVRSLGLESRLKTCMGVEYSPHDAHCNAYPLPATVAGFDPQSPFLRAQIDILKATPTRPIIQFNHPREGYFRRTNLSPITGDADDPQFIWDFDAVEIMNELGGYGLFTGGNTIYSVWDDWFNFLNKNLRVTGVGNTDTHETVNSPPGIPRDYVMCTATRPAEINESEIAQNIRMHRLSVARGVFVSLTADGHAMGTEYTPAGKTVNLVVEVKAPSWVSVDSLTVFGNGRVVWSGKIPIRSNRPLDYRKRIFLKPPADTWYVVKAEGKKSLWPVVPKGGLGDVSAVGFTNPVWVDLDGNGFECEREQIRRWVTAHASDPKEVMKTYQRSDWTFKRNLFAVLPRGSAAEHSVIPVMIASDNDQVRSLAYRRLAQSADSFSVAMLQSLRTSGRTPRERLGAAAYLGMIRAVAPSKLQNLDFFSLNKFVRDWYIAGPFENTGLDGVHPPEQGVDLSARLTGSRPEPVVWQHVQAAADGRVNLGELYGTFEKSAAYAYTVVEAPEEMTTVLMMGSDDTSALWLNGRQVFRREESRTARPGDDLLEVHLKKGENTFLLKVINDGGRAGYFFELLDPEKQLKFMQ